MKKQETKEGERKMIEKGTNKNKGITLIALVVTIIVNMVSYDKNREYCNLVGFSL